MSRLRLAKIATPSAPPATTCELFYSLTDLQLEAIDENGNILRLGPFLTSGTSGYRLIRVFMITASGTYTPTAGARAVYAECIGGGGGGGGAKATSANASVGGGGGAGSYSASFLTSLAANYTVTIGAGGGGGAAGAVGSPGNDTTFGSAMTAKGGSGGGAGTTAGTTTINAAGGAGGVAGTGDFTVPGQMGLQGLVISGTFACTGGGGSGIWGGGIASEWSSSTTHAGITPTAPGCGGEGGLNVGGGALSAVNGGTGAPGIVRVWEFA